MGALESVFHYGRDTIPRCKGSVGGVASNKHVIAIDVCGPAFQIAEQRVADILWKRQPHLVSPFSHHLKRAAAPVDVFVTQTRYICGS